MKKEGVVKKEGVSRICEEKKENIFSVCEQEKGIRVKEFFLRRRPLPHRAEIPCVFFHKLVKFSTTLKKNSTKCLSVLGKFSTSL